MWSNAVLMCEVKIDNEKLQMNNNKYLDRDVSDHGQSYDRDILDHYS